MDDTNNNWSRDTEILVSSENEAQKKRRGRPKKGTSSATTVRTARRPLPPMPVEEKSSKVWIATVANFVLLIAIFAIIFATHRSITNASKRAVVMASTAQPIVQEQIAVPSVSVLPETKAVVTVNEKVKAEEDVKDIDAENEELARIVKKEETVIKKKISQPTKNARTARAERASRYSTDPYTNSGPLDLDHRPNYKGQITGAEVERSYSTRSSEHYIRSSEHGNPWNSGGSQDLDYRKNYLSSTETDK